MKMKKPDKTFVLPKPSILAENKSSGNLIFLS